MSKPFPLSHVKPLFFWKFLSLTSFLKKNPKNRLKTCSIQILILFLQIKKLVYEYKDDKEVEIKNLLNNHQDLKSEIDKTKSNYEKVLDEATSEIDKFIEKVNQDNSVQ